MSKPQKANVTVKSGHPHTQFAKVLGGHPPKKSVEQIDAQNKPKNAPGSVRA
jgi:hypothetical protein